MKPEQFVYWLQGYLELSESPTLSETQVQIVKDHLALVFNKVTPDRQGQPTHTPASPVKLCSPGGASSDEQVRELLKKLPWSAFEKPAKKSLKQRLSGGLRKIRVGSSSNLSDPVQDTRIYC